MAVKIDTNVRMSGVITNSKIGIVKLSKPLGDSDVYKSASLTKYSDGDLVELIFRISAAGGSSSRQLVKVNKLEHMDRFWIGVVSVAELTIDEATSVLAEALNLEDDAVAPLHEQIVELAAETIPSVRILEGMTYDEAWDTHASLTEKFSGHIGFDVIKHTSSDMPQQTSLTMNHLMANLEWVGNFWIAPHLRPLFQVAHDTIAEGGYLNIMFKGDSGFGKTSNFEAIANWLGIPCYHINCAVLTDTEQWFGYPEARDGSTMFLPSDFTKAVVEGRCVIILDEFNRVEPWIHNSLFPILDYRRATVVHNEVIKCGPGIIFGATINDGFRYGGTNTIDAAIYNRFPVMAIVKAPPAAVEAEIITRKFPSLPKTDVNKLISLMNTLRRNQTEFSLSIDVSTRSAENIADLMRKSLTMRQAFQYTVINPAEVTEQKSLLDTVNSILGIDPLFS